MSQRHQSVTPELAHAAIEEMHALHLPITAKNYHVWFGHRVGWYPELSMEIERLAARGTGLNGETCEALYGKYISSDKQTELFHETESAARFLIESVLADVRQSNGSTCDYQTELDRFVDQLGDAANVGDVRTIVTELIVQTNKMESMRDQLKQNIEQANSDIGKLQEKLTKLERENMTDVLTGLHNRKALDRHLAACFEAIAASETPFCAIMLDVDHFKSFNDTYGHDVGDAVLRSVSMTLGDTGHPSAAPHRYGGEEFCVLVGECGLEGGLELAESIRKRIQGRQLKIARSGERIKPITISLGVAAAAPSDTPDSLIQRADKALYLAKRQGRNNVKSEGDLPPEAKAAS